MYIFDEYVMNDSDISNIYERVTAIYGEQRRV